MSDPLSLLEDPIKFQKLCWPKFSFYDRQVEIVESVRDNDKTVVPAGNMLGKDFIAAYVALWFFCSRKPCRVVTSSVDGPQLKGVLWGEIRRFLQDTKYKLPIKENELLIRHVNSDKTLDGLSYLIGRVTKKGEGLLGHHVARTDERPRTLFIGDEASGLDNETIEAAETWAHRMLLIGNCYPCNNLFKDWIKRGDVPREDGNGYHVKIIKIKGEHSPNVRLAESMRARGKPIPNIPLVPGVMDYPTYRYRRKYWDPIRQCIGLDAEFYEGAETLLYPPQWLDRAERIDKKLRLSKLLRKARSMGVDSGEGSANTVWTIVDELGILRQVSMKTKNTTDIPARTIVYIERFKLRPEDVLFDRGGGGKQHADYLRSIGYNVRTVGFGEPATIPEPKKYVSSTERREDKENRYVYKNRRAEMYGLLRLLLDPSYDLTEAEGDPIGELMRELQTELRQDVVDRIRGYDGANGFGISEDYVELRRQLAPLPLLYDKEGALYLPPKDKPTPTYKGDTIKSILGCSPDEADSLVLAVFGMLVKPRKVIIGAMN